jgi:uncharacterized HAD superfamily protein
MKVIYVDIDETICHRETSIDFGTNHDYTKAKPILENIEKINSLYDQGNTIVYWTARGSRKQKDWTDLTRKQLNEWGAKYHELKCDKPFYDLFIEDKSLRIEEL